MPEKACGLLGGKREAKTDFHGHGGQINDRNDCLYAREFAQNRSIIMVCEKSPGTDWQSGGHGFDPRQLHQ
jgi:hypothetical protein